ncbi:hypothetical protein EX30DRAFT_369082 [Ascodesmis nigricans]|uniref:DUF866-domain-containing protein n=1 Tax=Ascodesmis nigricans TaxID=341454 RepID=A0A4S2N3X0_9PEZI|nr:hypothetical protein EX30DRAFT_369082 [Ascodesmis nigricans]
MLSLVMTADLDGVTNLRPIDTEETPFYYMFKVQCTSCRETHPNWVGVNRFENREIHGSRGEANLVWKCKNCQRESSATIKSEPTPYAFSQPPKPQAILIFECRGCEFTEFKPEGEWECIAGPPASGGDEDGGEVSVKNATFSPVEFEDGEWYEYDDKNGREISIKSVTWEIRR